MKKLSILFASIALCCSSLWAQVDISLNTSSGPLFDHGEIGSLIFPEMGMTIQYSFDFSETDQIEAGINLVPFILPYAGAIVSYNQCLNPQSDSSRKWYAQYGLTAGLSFFSNCYVDEDLSVHPVWLPIPSLKAEVLFTKKPDSRGFYFAAGPSLGMGIIPAEKPEFIMIPGITLKTGFKF